MCLVVIITILIASSQTPPSSNIEIASSTSCNKGTTHENYQLQYTLPEAILIYMASATLKIVKAGSQYMHERA